MEVPKVCPFCGHPVIKTSNAVIYGKQYGSGVCYKCTSCDAYVGCHPNGSPLGTLANKATRDLRRRCHNVFDACWKLGGLSRSYCYAELSKRMNIPIKECHFAYFDIPKLTQALNILPEMKKELLNSKSKDIRRKGN